ncbi:unnamed protein product [Rotaria sp. Silwood2]|nr:unnamed protein product [Rotaria sp. Silwood2]CAF2641834.1 unnamed protein product [Rotaria sp. Silwood2]CAF2916373.1 unnamed protein product [Rotaria sp. Silwood2]CAF3018278.1 unnamed protein product [Rotaria sp. Silwood2]CAF3988776.1 unnamed protein product [Rotaria sp. Silwood2]
MGAGRSRKKSTPMPNYAPGGNRSVGQLNTGVGGASPMNQQQQLMQANQTIANLNRELQVLRGGAPMPYGGYPYAGGGIPPMPYGGYGYPGAAPMPYGAPPYGPPSPVLQRPGGYSPYGYPPMGGGTGYRDTDFAAIGNIAGLSPNEVAILHREYLNLTRGGTVKMDRMIVRQLLRDILLEANNEHVDRAIENIFRLMDRNQDGFIDFPEFVGAFKEVLKDKPVDSDNFMLNNALPDILTEQLRTSIFGSGSHSQQLALVQQPQVATQAVPTGGLSIVPLASTGIQQSPMMCSPLTTCSISNATVPFITLDPNQSSCVIATPGQYLITQPTALQCSPLPIM